MLTQNQGLHSADRRYRLTMQGDGKLVQYDQSTGSALWCSHTAGSAGAWAIMQGGGNLVVYAAVGAPLWSTHAAGNPGARLVVQNDGNLVVYAAGGPALWASRSGGGGAEEATILAPVNGTVTSAAAITTSCSSATGVRTSAPVEVLASMPGSPMQPGA